MMRLLAALRPVPSRADLRAQLARTIDEPGVTRMANKKLARQLVRTHDDLAAERGRDLPPAIAHLVAWYVRDPLAAVDALPTRDSVRAARDAWRPAPRDGV